MRAAVVTAYGTAPGYLEFPDPEPAGEHEIVVEVLAAGLHPRVRMQAGGRTTPVPAATLNCVIASWLALTQRISMRPGQNVLVLGASGGTGRMAVQVARRLGADQVVAVGRDPERLAALPGATATALTGDAETIAGIGAGLDMESAALWSPGEAATEPMCAAALLPCGRRGAARWRGGSFA